MAIPRAGALQVRRARVGEPWFTWRGAMREYHDAACRIAWNAYLDGELAGSAHAWVRVAGSEFAGDLWSFVDSEQAYVYGPYFNDPAEFQPIDTAYLHFQSLYVRQAHRRRGIGLALIEQVADIGLPTYCQFAADFLPPVFERFEPTDADLDSWERTLERPGGALASLVELAADDENGPEVKLRSGDVTGSLDIEYPAAGPGSRVRSVDAVEGEVDPDGDYGPEGRWEPDLAEPADHEAQWDLDDDNWLGEQVEEDLSFELSEQRSGVAIKSLHRTTVTAPTFDSVEPARYRFRITADVRRPALLSARASWRRFLATFDDEWDPATPAQALHELLRTERFDVSGLDIG